MLGLLTLGAWIALALWVVLRQRLRDDPSWLPWDTLAGVRSFDPDDAPGSVAQRLMVVTEACERATAGNASRADVETLAKAVVAAARMFVPQLKAEVRDYQSHAYVLQATASLEPLDTSMLCAPDLRRLARLTTWLSACCGETARLRLRLAFLRVGLERLSRRLAALQNHEYTADMAPVRAAHADLVVLARASVACSRALLGSLDASRRRIAASGQPVAAMVSAPVPPRVM